MENKKVFFGVDASTIKIKELLNKEFLELSLKAISDEKPNRNNTWFTYESLVNGKESFYNKPILGFFKNNDFVSHNGKWAKDEELDMNYWDTTGDGERCIGIIRESDSIEVVEDEKGLHWITLSCALWTSYCYKQVKRLLKDALKAQETGGATKNISVEVDLLDYEDIIDPDTGKTITKINSFELVGITILGSRNGVKVEPGIAGAELSVLGMDGSVFDRQVNTLRIAYEKLEKTELDINKEDNLMDNLEPIVAEEKPTETVVEETVTTDTIAFEQQQAEVTPELNLQAETDSVEETKTFEQAEQQEEEPKVEEPVAEESQQDVQVEETKTFEADPVCDLTWLIEKTHCLEGFIADSKRWYSKDGVIGGNYTIAVLEKQMARLKENEKDLVATLAKVISEDYVEDQAEIEHQRELAENCDCEKLYEDYKQAEKEKETFSLEAEKLNANIEELKQENAKYSDYEELKNKLAVFEQQALLNIAAEYAATAELDEELTNKLYENCKAGKYSDSEAIKADVAIMAFEAKPKMSKTIYQAPVMDTPSVDIFKDAAETSKKKKNCWDVLNHYNEK